MKSSLHLIRRLVALDDDGQWVALVFENPELLNPQILSALQEELQILTPRDRETLEGVLLSLNSLRNQIESGEVRYILGTGPIERIWSQLESGEINDSHADSLAALLGFEGRLSPLYCGTQSGHLLDLAHEGQWEMASRCARLVIGAVRALPGGEAELIRYANPILDWIEIAKEALIRLADRRIYQQALESGTALLREATVQKKDSLRGDVLHRLGVLSLDPYRSGRPSSNYAIEIEIWRRRLAHDYPSVLHVIPESEWLMPEPLEALRQSETLLRQAIDLRHGHEKGLTLKALTNNLEWRQDVLEDETVKRAEIVQLAMQSMEALDAAEDPAAMLDMMQTLDSYDTPIPQHHLQWLENLFLVKAPADYAQQFGDRRAVDIFWKAARFIKHKNPAKAIELVRATQDLIRRFGQEEMLITSWNFELKLVMSRYADDFEGFSAEDSLSDTLKKLQQLSEERGWSRKTIACHLLHLVMQAAEVSQEAFGLQILDQSTQLAPDIFQHHSEAILNLRCRLLVSLGAETYNRKVYGDSGVAYVKAIQILLQLGLVNRSLDILTLVYDVVADCEPLTAANLVYELQLVALEMEQKIGPAAVRWFQQMYRLTNSKLFLLGQTDLGVIAMNDLWQLAKGVRFAASLGGTNQLDLRSDNRLAGLLKRIAEVEPSLTEEAEATHFDDIQFLLEDLSLMGYEQEREQFAGRDSGQRLRNLQSSFDTYLNERLLSQSDQKVSYVTPAEVIDALDERTVLINYYIAQTTDLNHITINLQVFTHQSITAVTIPTGIENKSAAIGSDQQILLPPLAFEVSDVRYSVTQYPAFPGQPVSRETAKQLEFCQRLFFGSFLDELDQYRAQGKDHLCIIPHGPLHYFPFHLLGPSGRPLAENWIVTYLPHIKLLALPVSQTTTVPRNSPPIAMGVSFQQSNLFQQEMLPQSITETRAVAQIFDTDPFLDEEATCTRWTAALQSAPYVHLSTHGTHNRYAPAFQCLYLAPEGPTSGRFYAYELLGLNLQGLEVLTLSACESVLGRFDPSDNLRGIPAYLLMGGVRTLIGTLWKAQAEPAELFFTTFYKELFGGKSRLDAFAQAQRTTMQEFPEYKAWGSFYYIGDWRQ